MPEGVQAIEEEVDHYTSFDDSNQWSCFIIYTDASLLDLGPVLMQTQRVVAYVLGQLKIHE